MIGATTLNFTVPALTIAECIVVAKSNVREQICRNVEDVMSNSEYEGLIVSGIRYRVKIVDLSVKVELEVKGATRVKSRDHFMDVSL